MRAELNLKRSIGHHLVQSYLPSTLIVVVSWVSFWLDVDAIPARITLGVTTLLTISSESSDHQANLAPVSYVKALDVWMGTCTMFVFAAVLEFTFVSYLARKKLIVPVTLGDVEASQDLVLVVVSIKDRFLCARCVIRSQNIVDLRRCLIVSTLAFKAVFDCR